MSGEAHRNSGNNQQPNSNKWDINAEDAPWLENENLTVTFVNQEFDAKKMAVEAAQTRFEEELEHDRENSGFFKKVLNNIWKGGMARQYYIEKYRQEAIEQIKETGSIFSNTDIYTKDELDSANEQTIRRFMSENDNLIHKNAGENKDRLKDDTPEATELRNITNSLIEYKIKNPDIVEGSFDELVKLKMSQYAKDFGDKSLIKDGEFYLNNISQIADIVHKKSDHLSVVNSIDKEDAIRQVLSELEIVTGESRNTARTEIHYGKVEQAIEKFADKAGNIIPCVNRDSVAVASSLAFGMVGSMFTKGSRSILSKTIPILGSAITNGIFGGYNENIRLKNDRLQHQRRMAQGGEISNLTDLERQKLEEFQYDTVKASDVINTLDETLDSLPDLGKDLKPGDKGLSIEYWIRDHRNNFNGTDEEFNSHMAEMLSAKLIDLSFIESRIDKSDLDGIDLIHYTSLLDIEKERSEIDEKRPTAIAYIRSILNENPEIANKIFKGINNDDKFYEYFNQLKLSHNEDINVNIEECDDGFKSYRMSKVGKKVLSETIKGMAFGILAQETMAFFNDQNGLAEQLVKGRDTSEGVSDTLLAKGFNIFGDTNSVGNGDFVNQELEKLNLPESIKSLKLDGENTIKFDELSGKYDIVSSDGKVIVDNLEFTPEGRLTLESIQDLEASGFNISSNIETIAGETQTMTESVSIDKFIEHNQDGMVQTQINQWYNNNTSNFDLNELRLDAYQDQNGNVVISAARMIQGDSFTNGDFANTSPESMSFMVSVSRSTQAMNFELPLDSNGNFTITPDHPAFQLFEKGADNSVVFEGGFIQAVNTVGISETGAKLIEPLATIVGEDSVTSAEITNNIQLPPSQVFDYKMESPISRIPDFEMPPFVPNFKRKDPYPIVYKKREEIHPDSPEDPNDYYNPDVYTPSRNRYGGNHGGYPVIDKESIKDHYYPHEKRKTLGGKMSTVGNWYKDNIKDKNGEKYSKWIDKKIKESGLENMSPKTEAIFQVPVYAAGDSEANNFAKTIENGYIKQIIDNNQEEEAAIFLNINWGYNDEKDPVKLENIKKTLESMKDLKSRYPNIQIYPVYNTFTKTQLEVSGQTINQITKQNIDILITAITNQANSGKADRDFNPLIIKNDADVKALDKNYIKNIIDEAKNFPDTEAFTGNTVFDREIAKENPALRLGLEMMMAGLAYRLKTGDYHTAAANFACRAKSIAETGYGFNGNFFGAGGDDTQFGKMMDANRRMKLASGETFNDDFSKFAEGARIMTDADRQVKHYLSGETGLDVWGGDSFYNSDGYVGRSQNNKPQSRKSDIDLLSMPEDQAREEFSQRIERELRPTLSVKDPNKLEFLKKVLNADLGISDSQAKDYYSTENGKFELTDKGKKFFFDKMLKNNATHLKELRDRTNKWNIL